MITGQISVVAHQFISLNGYDITLTVPITIGEAINGAKFEIPTGEGSVQVSLPPQRGKTKKLRVKGQGLKNPDLEESGDLFVKTFIVAPDRANHTVKDAAAAIDAYYSDSVRRDIPKSLLPDFKTRN